MTFDKKGMYKYVAFKDPLKVKLADNSIILAYGQDISMFQYMM